MLSKEHKEELIKLYEEGKIQDLPSCYDEVVGMTEEETVAYIERIKGGTR